MEENVLSTAACMQRDIIHSLLMLDYSKVMLSPSELSGGKCIKGSLSRCPVISIR